MNGMRTVVVVDKVASVTQACGLSQEVRISPDIPSEEGVVVVVEVLNNKSTYNTLELTSGRMAKVGKGDIIVGALGQIDRAHSPFTQGAQQFVGSQPLAFQRDHGSVGIEMVGIPKGLGAIGFVEPLHHPGDQFIVVITGNTHQFRPLSRLRLLRTLHDLFEILSILFHLRARILIIESAGRAILLPTRSACILRLRQRAVILRQQRSASCRRSNDAGMDRQCVTWRPIFFILHSSGDLIWQFVRRLEQRKRPRQRPKPRARRSPRGVWRPRKNAP